MFRVKDRIREKTRRIEKALLQLSAHETRCTLCPRSCGVNRSAGERGFCGSGSKASVSHALLHFGEEPVLCGLTSGSGTVFFTGCNLKCLFCQNYQLSWLHQGKEWDDGDLARAFLGLQDKGALNINLVSPMHLVIPILKGLRLAFKEGLDLPIVYNTNAYENVSTLRLLQGIVDIYLPDLKFRSARLARSLCHTPDYFKYAGPAVKEMNLQQPRLYLDRRDVALSGLIIRHLVLPGTADDSLAILDWTAANISKSIGLSLMSQYVPCFRAPEKIRKKLTAAKYRVVTSRAKKIGVDILFIQPGLFGRSEHLTPDFDRENPFRWK